MRVSIHHSGEYGWVEYEPSNKEVMVTHPNEEIASRVRQYLKRDREIAVVDPNLPEGAVGGKRHMVVTPLSSSENLDMALTEMYHAIDVHVDWSKKEMDEDNPNKVILKSLFGNDEYDIIN